MDVDIIAAAQAELFRSLGDPVLVVDENNRLVEINPAATELLKIAPSSMGRTEVRESLDREEVLDQAPQREGPYFRVPPFLEEA